MKKTKTSKIAVATLAALGNVERRKRTVKYLQPYYKQGGRWYKVKV